MGASLLDELIDEEELRQTRSTENYNGLLAIVGKEIDPLGLSMVQLNYPDTNLGESTDSILSYLRSIKPLQSDEPTVALTFNRFGGDLHRDHIATNAIARNLAHDKSWSLLEYGLPSLVSDNVALSSIHQQVALDLATQHGSQFGEEASRIPSPYDALLRMNRVDYFEIAVC